MTMARAWEKAAPRRRLADRLPRLRRFRTRGGSRRFRRWAKPRSRCPRDQLRSPGRSPPAPRRPDSSGSRPEAPLPGPLALQSRCLRGQICPEGAQPLVGLIVLRDGLCRARGWALRGGCAGCGWARGCLGGAFLSGGRSAVSFVIAGRRHDEKDHGPYRDRSAQGEEQEPAAARCAFACTRCDGLAAQATEACGIAVVGPALRTEHGSLGTRRECSA